ncbi:diguanylate cyclase [Wukongibacter sp. M2B1]|uniref:sensor domain-containing diguanylate cyclase n=1 Tax=Wukongibacter sp. M2B1 TaxID=3088895 RepID=UPI003D79C862
MRSINFNLFSNKKIPEKYLEEFLEKVNHYNTIRRRAFLNFFVFIQLVIFTLGILNVEKTIYRHKMWMSLGMLVLLICIKVFLYDINQSIKQLLEFPVFLFIMLWSVLYEHTDYGFYGDNVMYISVAIFIAIMHLGPNKIILTSLITHTVFLIKLFYFQLFENYLITNVVSTTVFIAIACYVAVKNYENFIENFLKNKLIEEKSKSLDITNKELKKEIHKKNIMAYRLKENIDRFRHFYENAPSAILLIKNDKILYSNKITVKITGYEIDELDKMNWSDLIYEDMKNHIIEKFIEVQLGEEPITCEEIKIRSKSGEERWINVSANRTIHDGELGVIINAYDVTEERRNKEKIKLLIKIKDSMLEITQSIIGTDDIGVLNNLILEKALDIIAHANVGSILVIKNNRLVVASHRGYDLKEMNNFDIALEESFLWRATNGKIENTVIINDVEALHGGNRNYNKRIIRSSISAPILLHKNLYGMLNIDSKNKNAFTEEDRKVIEYFKNQIEVALNKHLLYEETIKLSRYDKLTNVSNRRHFEEVFENQLKNAKRNLGSLYLVIFDLNGMKTVNDTYGHLAGDEYLRQFANKLKNNIRKSDLLARYGGDEFIAVFSDMKLIDLKKKLENINNEIIRSHLAWEGNTIKCSFSYGIANFPNDAKEYKNLVKVADQRMYEYKKRAKYE